MTSHVLISGAGIAGPALALWLNRAGFRTTIVERATELREGGQAIDFRGPVHRAVLERMGLWDAIHERRTRPGPLHLLDAKGRRRATLPEVMMSGDVEILRGDLVRLLYERTRAETEYRFGDRIVRLEQNDGSVLAEFAGAAAQTFDLVIGADGLHSGVRELAIANEQRTLTHHGYRIATFGMRNRLGLERGAVVYSVPGRAAAVFATSEHDARVLFVSAGDAVGGARRDMAVQKAELRANFGDLGWEVPRLLDALDESCDLYVDSIATVQLERYSSGRIALLGDAAFGGTLGGQGSALAIVGAYVLAGELAGDAAPQRAFERYEAKLRPYATRCQKGAGHAGPFFAPRSGFGLALRNVFYGTLTSPLFAPVFEWLVKDAASAFALPEFPALDSARTSRPSSEPPRLEPASS
jgi:2-polyprenyl-6-methoxyphenol hydroxylase-like FAD-dependent oxidoreductase